MTDRKLVSLNIKEFNEISAVILGEIYKSHPHPKVLDSAEIAKLLGISQNDKLPSGETFQGMFSHTVSWLGSEGVINLITLIAPHRATLTAKTLAAMTPSVGSALVVATSEGSSTSGKSKLAELMGEFLGAFAGSLVKSVASS
jgi:hypothetical protein